MDFFQLLHREELLLPVDALFPEAREIRRLYNGGKWDDALLTKDEVELKRFYSTLLNICTSEKSISQGKFFDLMYVNPMSEYFNPNQQYAFLRADGRNALLVVVNFSGNPIRSSVHIPRHAFDYMGLKEKNSCLFTELLTNQKMKADLYADLPLRFNVPALSGVVLKWTI